jgi:hypothetical protein
MARRRFGLDKDSFILEIGSNDGYLLKNFIDIPHLGIEPSIGPCAKAREIGVATRQRFFTSSERWPLSDLIICNNVLGHVPDLNDFIKALSKTLKASGTVTIEFPHALKLIQNCEFDTIYHEHFSYLSMLALEPLFNRYGMHTYDVEELPTHGGSLRLYVGKCQIEKKTVEHLRHQEKLLKFRGTYAEFAKRAEHIRQDFVYFTNFHSVVGYGAAAKGNTFLNYCDISTEIAYVADVTPAKQGKFLPGSHIPVVSEEYLLKAKPDFVLILPWNWKDEIVERLKVIREWGGQFITCIPELTLF